jgi:hypothetical protein
MGPRGEYGPSKIDSEEIMNEDRRTAKGEDKTNTEKGVTGMIVFDLGVVHHREFSRRWM